MGHRTAPAIVLVLPALLPSSAGLEAKRRALDEIASRQRAADEKRRKEAQQQGVLTVSKSLNMHLLRRGYVVRHDALRLVASSGELE